MIIAILAGMLLPALNKAREQGKRIRCLNNLKQFGLGLQLYAVDHKDFLTPYYTGKSEPKPQQILMGPKADGTYQYTGSTWNQGLYISRKVLICPSMNPPVNYALSRCHYGVNHYLFVEGVFIKLSKIKHVAKKIAVADTVNNTNFSEGFARFNPNPTQYENAGYGRISGRHSNSANVAHLDGSARNYKTLNPLYPADRLPLAYNTVDNYGDRNRYHSWNDSKY